MFTRDELLRCNCWPGPDDDPPPLVMIEFDRRHYRHAVHGPLAAHLGDKADFSSALSFWVWSEQLFGRPRTPKISLRLAEETLCQPLDEQAWIEALSIATWPLKPPLPEFLARIDGFVAGMRMYGGWVLDVHRVSLLAEFDDSYVAWHERIVP